MSYTVIIIVITALVSIGAFNSHKIYNDLILYPPAVNRGQYYRLLTSGFIHADYMHLAFNMLTLWFFGRVMEDFIAYQTGKPWIFPLFYLAGIVVSDIPTYLKHRNSSGYASLGASGGVAAVLFAFIMQAPWQTIYIFILPVPAIIFAVAYLLYSQYMRRKGGDNINHDAHFWGAIFGIVAICFIIPSTISRFLESIQHPQFNF